MTFDEDPQDDVESYACMECADGSIEFNDETGKWECGTCSWTGEAEVE